MDKDDAMRVLGDENSMQTKIRSIIMSVALLAALPASAQVALESRFSGQFVPTIDGDYGDWLGEEMGGDVILMSLGGDDLVQGGDGWMDDDDLGSEVAFAHNKKYLFFAATVRDDVFARGKKPGKADDHVEIWFGAQNFRKQKVRTFGIGIWANPKAGGGDVQIMWLKPGSGKVGKKVGKAEGAVDGDTSSYHVELRIPWSAFPGGEAARVGMRAAVYIVDCDTKARIRAQSIFGTAPIESRGSAHRLPLLGQSDLTASLDAFWKKMGFSSATGPHFAMAANLIGDRKFEQLVIVDRYIMAYGGAMGAPGTYDYLELSIDRPDQITKKQLLDTTGDGKQEAVLEFLEDDGTSTRRWFAVYKVMSDRKLKKIFSAAILVSDGIMRIENRYRFVRAGGRKRAIEISPVAAVGVEQGDESDVPKEGGNPMALPWNKPSKIKYIYKGNRFQKR